MRLKTTHCKHGHAWTETNTGWRRRPGKAAKRRFCRACANRWGREHRARQAAARGPRPPRPPKLPAVRGHAWAADTYERFFSKVRKLPLALGAVMPRFGLCWIWIGRKKPDGYGRITAGGREWRAHRLAWVLYGGSLPDDVMVTHRCDNRSCVRRSHLRLGTHQMNMAEAFTRGRIPKPNVVNLPSRERRERFYTLGRSCPRGHALTPANTRWRWQWRTGKGWSQECKRCRAIAERERGKRKRAVKRAGSWARARPRN